MALFEDDQLVANSEIVLITGHASVESSVQALRLGAADCLVKPVNMRRLQGLLFERAAGGTLFLNDVTDTSAELQDKLLRVLETGRFMRVGSAQSLDADVRVVVATNREPLQAVAEGKLREDLMYRLNVFPIEVPPLRERLEDVPLLAAHFLQAIGQQEGHTKHFNAEALHRLSTYRWLGNVRALCNAVQRACVMTVGAVIDMQWLPIGHAVSPRFSAAQPISAFLLRHQRQRAQPSRRRLALQWRRWSAP